VLELEFEQEIGLLSDPLVSTLRLRGSHPPPLCTLSITSGCGVIQHLPCRTHLLIFDLEMFLRVSPYHVLKIVMALFGYESIVTASTNHTSLFTLIFIFRFLFFFSLLLKISFYLVFSSLLGTGGLGSFYRVHGSSALPSSVFMVPLFQEAYCLLQKLCAL
jgi:hypothetical protein